MVDELLVEQSDCPNGLVQPEISHLSGKPKLELSVRDLHVVDSVEESFDDLIARNQWALGHLVPLNALRLELEEGEETEIHVTGLDLTDQKACIGLQTLFTKAGFTHLQVVDVDTGVTISARKRPLIQKEYGNGIVLSEVIDPGEIARCHAFANEVFYYRDFNYDYEVARQFDPNADMFAVYNGNGDLLSIGRMVVRLPGYYCPFMLATLPDGSHWRVPKKHGRIGEVMGLYREGKEGSVGLKKLMEYLTQFAYYIAKIDSIWTTYDEADRFTGTYYKRKLLMRETGIQLVYRDFGGLWNLICTDKMSELKDVNETMFSR